MTQPCPSCDMGLAAPGVNSHVCYTYADRWAFIGYKDRMGKHAKSCTYELIHTDEVGEIWVCEVHGQNTRLPFFVKPDRPSQPPCLEMYPWDYMLTQPYEPNTTAKHLPLGRT